MLSKKKQRLQQRMEERQQLAKRQRQWFIAIATILAFTISAVVWQSGRSASNAHQNSVKSRVSDDKWTVKALLALKPNQLEGMDIALVNLLCAEGLRGSGKLDIDTTLDRLDEFATRVRMETDRNMHRFDSNPSEYQKSKPYYRMLMLVSVLQQDFGIRYNPERVTPVGVFEPSDKFFADSRDVFLHGLTGEPSMGTCSSLPVLYVAVGRRLHYPLSLVGAKCHLFLRWEDQTTRLNIEGASLGMNTYDDAHYRAWPYPMSAGEEKENHYLKNMTAAEECAVFLSTRGQCLMAAGRLDEAIAAHEAAARLTPDSRFFQTILNFARRDVAARRAPEFPRVGMPPDPTLWDEPPEIAWVLWHQQQALRHPNRLLPGGIPEPQLGIPTTGNPINVNNFNLTQPPKTR
jgi:hypothetical protein